MNGKNLHDAMEFVGQDLVDLAEKQRFRRSALQIILPTAAAVALIWGVGTALTPYWQPAIAEPAVEEKMLLEEIVVVEEELPEVQPEEDRPETPTAHPLLSVFPQLDAATLPETEEWETFYLNEAGLEDQGTEMATTQGDQVLAVDAQNGILLVRVQGADYQGVLAIAKDPGLLSQQAAKEIGTMGQTMGEIAQAYDGVLAICGSRFLSEDGSADGGNVAAYTMCEGVEYNGETHLEQGAVRLEIDGDGKFRLVDSQTPVGTDTENAVEVPTALIENGNIVVDEGYNGVHPRACLGQTAAGEILMLVIEGRLPEVSLGTGLPTCAEILKSYGCETAIPLDHGTSAMLWFDGEYVTRCSNRALPQGRLLPTAFVVARKDAGT